MKMREILFRGKTPGGKWVEGIYSPYNWDIDLVRENKPQIIILSENKDDIDGLWCDIIPETAGQYTGLTDKNGVKIFEGDIVKGTAYSATMIGVIVNAPNPTAWLNSSILRCAAIGKTDEFAAEVIGNIHDNPELLNAAANERR